MSAPRILVVSASDTRFMPLLQGMIDSLAPVLARPTVHLACFDIGLTASDREWLHTRQATIAVPRPHLGVGDEHPLTLLSFLARPFLPEYFPGYDVYVWVDSDIWFQNPAAIDRYVEAALAHGMAITHERERGYRFQPWLFGWTAKHFLLGYGPLAAAFLLSRKHLNAGLFALRAGAPQWGQWATCYAVAIARTNALVPHDQFALNHALHSGARASRAALLDPGYNWICDRGVPMWNDAASAFCKPYPPYEPIAALHLAGPAKRQAYSVRRTGGGTFRTFIVHGASPVHPAGHSPLDVVAAATPFVAA